MKAAIIFFLFFCFSSLANDLYVTRESSKCDFFWRISRGNLFYKKLIFDNAHTFICKTSALKKNENRLNVLSYRKIENNQKDEAPLAKITSQPVHSVSSPSSFQVDKNFPIPDRLKNDVVFWRDVYATTSTHEVLLYDSKTKFIYEKLSLPKIENDLSSLRYKKVVEKRLKDITDILKKIADNVTLPADNKLAQAVYETLKKHSMLKEKDLVQRLRYQNGLREQFEYGLKTSGRYADDMKAVLRAYGLPEDLLALVFVESLFYLSAVSHASATGPWGFLKETALNCGIHVNNSVDERLDPVKATMAAAVYLLKAKQGLVEWPLAITSYNHGYAGMKRIVNNFSLTDLDAIIALPEPPLGYASRSYYTEFLAAREILRNQENYFPGLVKERPWRYETVQLEQPVLFSDLLSAKAIDSENFSRLNFSLTKRTIKGQETIPQNYVVRLPLGKSKHFYTALKKIPVKKRLNAAEKVSLTYKVSGKESLYAIAKRLDISLDLLTKKLGQPKEYRPKSGKIRIRSAYYLTSNDKLLSSLPGTKGEKSLELSSN